MMESQSFLLVSTYERYWTNCDHLWLPARKMKFLHSHQLIHMVRGNRWLWYWFDEKSVGPDYKSVVVPIRVNVKYRNRFWEQHKGCQLQLKQKQMSSVIIMSHENEKCSEWCTSNSSAANTRRKIHKYSPTNQVRHWPRSPYKQVLLLIVTFAFPVINLVTRCRIGLFSRSFLFFDRKQWIVTKRNLPLRHIMSFWQAFSHQQIAVIILSNNNFLSIESMSMMRRSL